MTSSDFDAQPSVSADTIDSEHVASLVGLAESGLSKMYQRGDALFAFTRRAADLTAPNACRLEGTSVRYSAIAALGAQFLPQDRQRQVLGGQSVVEICSRLARSISTYRDFGEVALVSWLCAETNCDLATEVFDSFARRVTAVTALPTVQAAWALSAAVAFRSQGLDRGLTESLNERLLASRHPDGVLFPHHTDPSREPWFRRRVGCFADQVYPIQALARHYSQSGDKRPLEAANQCAERISTLQGDAGQWWWHYDWQRGDVIEGYPVYSVHQHAMAPMALLDLKELGGNDFSWQLNRGLDWLSSGPEITAPLINEQVGVIWRKVARREPVPKLVRGLRAAARPVGVSRALSWLDRVAKPGAIDLECRPYELGWLLYAWLPRLAALRATQDSGRDVLRSAVGGT